MRIKDINYVMRRDTRKTLIGMRHGINPVVLHDHIDNCLNDLLRQPDNAAFKVRFMPHDVPGYILTGNVISIDLNAKEDGLVVTFTDLTSVNIKGTFTQLFGDGRQKQEGKP